MQYHGDESHLDFDERGEDAWVYLSGPMRSAERNPAAAFYDRLAEICEETGWHVYRPYRDIIEGAPCDEVALFDRLRHAVRHAQACVVYVGLPSSGVGAELTLAREGGRPIIAVYMDGDEVSPVLRSMLRDYERAVLVRGVDPDDCISSVRQAIRDPAWNRIVRVAASEHPEEL